MPSLSIDGACIHYETAGTGAPALVLVHGGMCDGHDWQALVPRLAPHARVVTPDLRGHGRSTGDPAGFSVERCAADLNALVDALDLTPAILVGHSFASRVVVAAAGARPGNAAGLVLLDGSRSVGGRAASPARPIHASALDAIAATIGPRLDEAARGRVMDTMLAASPALMAACVAAIDGWDRDRADGAFLGLPPDLPVLAIQSTYHDQATPRRSLSEADGTPYLDFLVAAVPGIAVRVLPDTGHFSMIERPAEVAALLLAFADACATQPNRRGPA